MIALLKTALSRPAARTPASRVVLGIGDDAAVLEAGPGQLVVTVDVSVEGTHFKREWLDLTTIAERAVHAAVSDLAAMAAEPLGAVSSLVLPQGFSAAEVSALGRGQARAQRTLNCPIVGGNISRGEQLSITTCVLGRSRKVVTRSGARPGDELWLIGDVGLARAGLLLLMRGGYETLRRTRAQRKVIAAWSRPRAKLVEGLALRGKAHALIDVSDGLAKDANELARSSQVRLVIDSALLLGSLPPALHEVAQTLGCDALALALEGGEDYALLAAGPRRRRPTMAVPIGTVEAGRGVKVRVDGKLRSLRGGFEHFRG